MHIMLIFINPIKHKQNVSFSYSIGIWVSRNMFLKIIDLFFQERI